MVDLGDSRTKLSKVGPVAETGRDGFFHFGQGILGPADLVAPARGCQAPGPGAGIIAELFGAECYAAHRAYDQQVKHDIDDAGGDKGNQERQCCNAACIG